MPDLHKLFQDVHDLAVSAGAECDHMRVAKLEAEVAALRKEWDENKHPRDKDGKFASGQADSHVSNSAHPASHGGAPPPGTVRISSGPAVERRNGNIAQTLHITTPDGKIYDLKTDFEQTGHGELAVNSHADTKFKVGGYTVTGEELVSAAMNSGRAEPGSSHVITGADAERMHHDLGWAFKDVADKQGKR